MNNKIITGRLILQIAFVLFACVAFIGNSLSSQYFEIDVSGKPEKTESPNVATVGFTSDCDFYLGNTRVQDAIDDLKQYTELRITVGIYNELLTIDKKNISLKGGYNSCSDAAKNISQILQHEVKTIIRAPEIMAGSVVTILGNDKRYRVSMENISVMGGSPGVGMGGGIVAYHADLELNLTHVWTTSNIGLYGGGVSIFDGNTDVFAKNFHVAYNQSINHGGGVYCHGSDNTITIDYFNPSTDVFGIAYNQASDGGGVHIANKCQFITYVGTAKKPYYQGNDDFDLRGINFNMASISGGGINVASEGRIHLRGKPKCTECVGNYEDPLTVYGNSANLQGGGVYVSGSGSVAQLSNVWLGHNHVNNAVSEGGGIAVNYEALVLISGGVKNKSDCWQDGECTSLIDGNYAKLSGGAISVKNGSQVWLSNSKILYNYAHNGAAIFASDWGSLVDANGTLIALNRSVQPIEESRNTVHLENNAMLQAVFLTIADNDPRESIIFSDTASIKLDSALIHEIENIDTLPYIETGLSTTEMNCMLVHNDSNLNFATNLYIDDPMFVARGNGDYHIDTESSAVDMCVYPPSFDFLGFDFEGDDRDLTGLNAAGFDEIKND